MTTKCIIAPQKPRIDGYVAIRRNRKMYYAHRYEYEIRIGKIPKGLTLDHLCKTRNCINVKHLEPVTLLENIKRASGRNNNRAGVEYDNSRYNLTKPPDTCFKGHKDWVVYSDNKNRCRTCKNATNRRYYSKLRRD